MDDNSENQTGNHQFTIELGDIIQIISPTNSDFNDYAFYVSYVDSSKIKLININTYTLAQLTLDEDGTITDESIREIHLLTRSTDAGFARQNNLLPQTWIDIHFGGEMPYIATGEITNLEEDMIEIKTIDNTVFYIDFEYKGLPEDIPIDKIIIRDAPANAIHKETTPDAIVEPSDTPASIEYTENGESIIHIPSGTIPDTPIQEVLHEIYLDANELYGEDLKEIFQTIEIPEYQKKYTIETQVNDFMDELLSTIPNSKRTDKVMSRIHNLVERFKELRNMYSKFDENGNVIREKMYGDLYKPIIDHILHLDTRLRWLIPVAEQTKKIYNSEIAGTEDAAQIEMATSTLILNEADELNGINTSFENYYNNTIVGNELKYDRLQSKIHAYMMPFVPPTNNDSLLTFKQEVMQDLDAIVKTIRDTETNQFKYMVQRYNLGTYRPSSTEMKGGMKISIKTPIFPPDKISIQSLYMLPYPAVKYSHVDLPGTNIMIRSQLSQTHMDFFRLFHKSSQFSFKFIDDLNKEIDYNINDDNDEEVFLKKVNEYILDDSLQNEDDKYRKLLEVIIPKTRILIKLMQKYNPNKMSLIDVISTLEPFLIYPNNITYGQYNEIRYHIRNQIHTYKANIAKKSRDFKNILKQPKNVDNTPRNIIRDLIINLGYGFENSKVIEEIFTEDYNSYESYTTSETLNVIINKDGGALFCNLITYMLLKLITPNKLLESFQQFDLPDLDIVMKQKDCITRYLAKKYESISDLQKDNHGDVYWDKDLDTTAYSILEKYKDEKAKILPEKFISFLAENLVQKHDVNRNLSIEMANTLIRGKKKVVNGEYAVVELTRKEDEKNEDENRMSSSNKYYHYYVRKENQWVRDNSIDENSFLDTPSLFCNVSPTCYYDTNKNTCDSNKDAEIRMKRIVQSSAMKEFDRKFSITVEELKKQLENNIQSLSTLLARKTILSESIMYKENRLAYDIGKYATKHEMVQSPHILLRDMILSQEDFVKKQNDICKFVTMFCREPIIDNGEDIHWKYCMQTNVKLFPYSLYQLAYTFITGDDYQAMQDKLCHEVGQLSDDGDAFVDKYSGYVLRKIDFVNEEIYDDSGFKITTHGIIEKDISTVASEMLSKKDNEKVFENELSQMIYNVFHALCSNISVDPVDHEEFVLRTTLEMIQNKDIVFSEEKYTQFIKDKEKKTGKVLAPYAIYRNQILITCICSLLLVSLQSSLVSIRPRKTFPGCVYSFGGYPLDSGIENLSGIKYISCVVVKSKSSIVPWNSIQNFTDGMIQKRIIDLLQKYILPKNEINEMIVRKREYLILHPDDSVPKHHDVAHKWKQFLPPMIPITISSTLQGTTKSFDDETVQLIKQGNKLQNKHYDVYKSKIIQHTYGIVELINENVQSKDVLMKTMSKIPFLENACCNESDKSLNPIQYFISENKNIDLYIKRSVKCETISKNMKEWGAAPYLFNKENTQFVYPQMNDNFYEKEQHIYNAIIYYCNFDSELPIPDDLRIICREKPAGYDKNMSLEEKIEFLKKNGKKYTSGDLSQLMNIVNTRNIQLVAQPKTVKPVAMLLDFLDNMDQQDSIIIEEPLRRHLRDVLANYNPNIMVHEKDVEMSDFAKATKKLRSYISKANNEMHEKIMEYINNYGNLSNLQFNKVQDHILNLFTWNIDDNTANSLFQMTGFIKNSIYNMTKLYPEMLVSNRTHVFLSEYWGFSGNHMDDLKNEIQKYNTDVQKHRGNKILTDFMLNTKNVKTWANEIYMFANLIPIQSPIIKNGETFYGLFRKDTIYMLLMYCWYSTVFEYIQNSYDPDLTNMNMVYSKNNRREKNRENIEERNESMTRVMENMDDDVQDYITEVVDIELGDEQELKTAVCSFLITCIETEQKDKKTIDKKYTDISRSMKRTKDQEKQEIIRRFEDSDSKIEKMLKKHKLDRWNIGNQESLFKYNKDAYDREREQIDGSMFEQAEPHALDVEDLARMDADETDKLYEEEAVDISGLDEEYYDGAYYQEDVNRDFGYDD
jgi:hypothetical protein